MAIAPGSPIAARSARPSSFRKGPLREWLTSGAVTVADSDSLAGTRQDTIIGTSPVRFNHAETFGRLLPSWPCP